MASAHEVPPGRFDDSIELPIQRGGQRSGLVPEEDRLHVRVRPIATYMLPPIALVIPLYQIMSGLDLLDTRIALIIIYSSFVTPFVIWIMRGYIEGISPELDDAARVDGCSRLGALVRVILPVSAPGLISTGLLAFLLSWDEFFYALVMTQTNAAKTVPVALNDFIGRHGIDFGMLAAGGVLAAIPPVVIAVVFQRYLVAGLTAGGVKG